MRTRSRPEESEWSLAPATVLALLEATTPQELFRWGVEVVEHVTDADLTTFARRDEGLLVPTVSTKGDDLEREHGFPLDTSIPGAALLDGRGVVIDDRADRRGDVVAQDGSFHPERHRSMLCVPVGEYGVLIAFGRQQAAFGDRMLAHATDVARIVETALENRSVERGETGSIESDTLEEIARLVSHDMTNKLSIARGRIELARRDEDLGHLVECENALEGIESIAQITATLARTGAPIDHMEPVTMEDAAEEVFASLETGAATLTIHDSLTVQADRGCLVQILENLFRNAIDHGSSDVSIDLGTIEGGFYVADDGPGIPEDLRKTVRKPGFSTRSDNAGKGLTIVDRLASAHGWTMTITESSSGGARVEFRDVSLDEPT